MSHSLDKISYDPEYWAFGETVSSPEELRQVLSVARENHQPFESRHNDHESYPHTVYKYASQRQTCEELSIVYHSGYSGSARVLDPSIPHHGSNLVLAVQELIKEGYEPAKHVAIYAMTHLGSTYQKGPYGQPAEKGPLWNMDDWVQSTKKTFQGLPHYTQKAIFGNSLGADILIKSVLDYEASNKPNKIKLAGVFGLSSALNALDENFRQRIFNEMSDFQKVKHDVGLGVTVEMGGTKYRFNKSFYEQAKRYELKDTVDRFEDIPVQFVHSLHDGVMPFDKIKDEVKSIFGQSAKVQAFDHPEDPAGAHALNTTQCLEEVRETTKQWIKDVCETSGVAKKVLALR